MKYKLIIIVLASQILTGCFMYHGSRENVVTVLTGECLQDTELTYIHVDQNNWEEWHSKGLCFLTFDLTMKYKYEKDGTLHSYVLPSDDIYKSFGKNKQKVQDTFMSVVKSCEEANRLEYSYFDITLTTILYDGGLSLVADKDFAGYQAGEELAKYLTIPNTWYMLMDKHSKYNTSEQMGRILDIPLEYSYLIPYKFFTLALPVSSGEITTEYVTFELKVPVKVVNYLEWINDKISNPQAPVPYKEEVLHCTFSTKYNIK